MIALVEYENYRRAVLRSATPHNPTPMTTARVLWVDIVRIFSRLTEQLRESAFYRAEKEEDGTNRTPPILGGASALDNNNLSKSNSSSHSNNSNGNNNSDLSSQYEALLNVFNAEDDDDDDDDDDVVGVGDININNNNANYTAISLSPTTTTSSSTTTITTTSTMTARDIPLNRPPAIPLAHQPTHPPRHPVLPLPFPTPQSIIHPPGVSSHYGSSKLSSFFSHAGNSLSHMLGDPPLL